MNRPIGRIGCTVHAHDTKDEMDELFVALWECATQMLEIKRGGGLSALPAASWLNLVYR